MIVLVTKFAQGAWIVVLAAPILFLAMKARLAPLRAASRGELAPTAAGRRAARAHPHRRAGLQPARADAAGARLRPGHRPGDAEGVNVAADEATTRCRANGSERGVPVPLVVIESPYRETVRPVLRYVHQLLARAPRDVVSVVIPEYVVEHWWQNLLHNQTALRLKGRLLFEPSVTVTSVPWVLAVRYAEMTPESPTSAARTSSTTSAPSRIARTLGLSRRRQLAGLALALVALPLLTLLLDALDDQLSLDGQVLLYLLAVVLIALVGGVVVGGRLGDRRGDADQLLLRRPAPHADVADPDQAVALVVFVAVAALVSGAVEIAVRRAQAAERARAEAETISALAGPDLDGEESLREVLRQALETFRMESVRSRSREPGSSDWVDVDHVGWAPAGRRPRSVRRCRSARGCAWSAAGRRCSPRTTGSSKRLPPPPATAYEGHRLSGEAEEARALATVDQQRTALLAAVGHDLRTPLAGIKAA